MKTRYWLIIIGIIILVFCVREGCNQRTTDNLVQNITTYKDSAKFEHLKNGALISTNTSLKLQSEEQVRIMASNINDTVKEMLKKFKSLSNVTYVTNQFFTGKDTLKFETKIPCNFKPFKVRREEPKSYRFVGTIGQDYFSIDSLAIPDSMSLVFGRKKQGFLKYDYAVDINHSNPLMKTTNIKDYKYDPQKKWYEKTWAHWIEGAIMESVVRQGIQTYIKSR